MLLRDHLDCVDTGVVFYGDKLQKDFPLSVGHNSSESSDDCSVVAAGYLENVKTAQQFIAVVAVDFRAH